MKWGSHVHKAECVCRAPAEGRTGNTGMCTAEARASQPFSYPSRQVGEGKVLEPTAYLSVLQSLKSRKVRDTHDPHGDGGNGPWKSPGSSQSLLLWWQGCYHLSLSQSLLAFPQSAPRYNPSSSEDGVQSCARCDSLGACVKLCRDAGQLHESRGP